MSYVQLSFAHCLRSAHIAHNRLPALPRCFLDEAKGLEIMSMSSGAEAGLDMIVRNLFCPYLLTFCLTLRQEFFVAKCLFCSS